MRFNVERSGGFYDGWVDVTLLESDEEFQVLCKYHVRFGVNIKWLGFKGMTFDDHSEFYVSKEYLSEKYLQGCQALNFNGIQFAKVNGTEFNFCKSGVDGKIFFSFDGSDPAEIRRIEANIGVGPVKGRLTLVAV